MRLVATLEICNVSAHIRHATETTKIWLKYTKCFYSVLLCSGANWQLRMQVQGRSLVTRHALQQSHTHWWQLNEQHTYIWHCTLLCVLHQTLLHYECATSIYSDSVTTQSTVKPRLFTVFTQMASCYVPAKHIHGGVCHTAQVVGVETLRKVL